MIVTFKESLSRLKIFGFTQSEINEAVRKALIGVGHFLIEVNLRQRKFAADNRQRYGFRPRSAKHEARKRREFIFDPETRLKVRPGRPPTDLVYTGRLKAFIEAKPADQYRMLPTATSNRIRLRIPIPVPGRRGGYMRSEQYRELSKYSALEYVEMRKIFIANVATLLGFKTTDESKLWRGAA